MQLLKKADNKRNVSIAERKEKLIFENYEELPLQGFRGFGKVPRVYLTRHDITPFLNKVYYRERINKCKLKVALDNSIHSKRLKQKCVVNVINQDLEKLRREFLTQPHQRQCTESILALNDNINSIFKCKICDKSYSSHEKLFSHEAKAHIVLHKTDSKAHKRVSFCEQVIIHEVEEYHKCRKCAEIFSEYKMLKMHVKKFHKKPAEITEASKVEVNNSDIKMAVSDAGMQLAINEVKDIAKMNGAEIKKGVAIKKSKKTIFSKHQCQNCGRYYSSSSTLKRHVNTYHADYDTLQCKVCEETFAWPSLLRAHKCIRLKQQEMPFEDARPEIHFDNLNLYQNNDLMNTIDLEIPAAVIDLTEDIIPSNRRRQVLTNVDGFGSSNQGGFVDIIHSGFIYSKQTAFEQSNQNRFGTINQHTLACGQDTIVPSNQEPNLDRFAPLSSLGYKVIMQQEVPIEF